MDILIKPYELLKKVRYNKPVIHHLTNWVTIYDCANVVKVFGASPVMAHANEEVEDMVQIASALVLNIGTLTNDFVESMKKAAKAANLKNIPVILDVCGVGATRFRDTKCFEIIDFAKISIIKGNASEIARFAGEDVKTKGVDSTDVKLDLVQLAKEFAKKSNSTVVITGAQDISTDGDNVYLVSNGDPLMACVVGTGCMATSVIGTFAAIEQDFAYAAACGLSCFEIAAEIASEKADGPGSFKHILYDEIYRLDEKTICSKQRILLYNR